MPMQGFQAKPFSSRKALKADDALGEIKAAVVAVGAVEQALLQGHELLAVEQGRVAGGLPCRVAILDLGELLGRDASAAMGLARSDSSWRVSSSDMGTRSSAGAFTYSR